MDEVTTEQKQEHIKKIMKKELKRLKTLIFKYQHRDLLEHKLTLTVGDLKYIEDGTGGIYETLEGTNEYDYAHKITIDGDFINLYFDTTDKFWKLYYKNSIRGVVIHELCHAITYEIYNDLTEIKGVNNDASPIFLCLLYFVEEEQTMIVKKLL